jgi:Putative endonuclease, protein of unknown function (DUF1780)
MNSPDGRYLQQLREHAAETRRLWSNHMKPERERMVCRAFLRCLGIPFDENELINGPAEPTDVSFRDARFQITEIIEPSRRRADEWRKRHERYVSASMINDVLEPPISPRPVSYESCLTIVEEHLHRKAARYGRACSDLDVLVSMRAVHHGFLDITSARRPHSTFGIWRSVSILFLPYGEVLATTDRAPAFLRSVQEKPCMEWPQPDGWFDA